MNNDINNQETIDLLQLFVIAKQNLLLFITICFVCVAGAFCVTKFFIKEEFTAEAKMIIVQKSDTTTSQQNYTYSDVQLSQKLASTYNEIIMSEAISDTVINNLDLDTKYNITNDNFSKIVTVSSANNTEVMNIKVVTNDPELSADIANEIVRVFEKKIYDIMQIENVTSLSEAKVPTKRSGPSTTKNCALGLVMGVVICGAIAVIILLTDTKVKSEEDVKKIFDSSKIHIIGNIPELSIKEEDYD